jgi:hypothetical protein
MIYFGYPLDINGWKTKPEIKPDTKPKTEPENHGWEIIPKPNLKTMDIRPEPDPLPSLVPTGPFIIRLVGLDGLRVTCTCGTILHLHPTCGTW